MNISLENRLFIDSVDAFSEYGIYVVENGYNELVSYPSMKTVVHNDWQEDNGIEIDQLSMRVDSQEAQVRFAYCDTFNYEALATAISGTVTHTWDFTSIGRIYRLRTLAMPRFERHNGMGFITIRFAVVELVNGTNTQNAVPLTTLANNPDYKLDNVMLSKYNIKALKGTLAEVTKMPAVKPVMSRNISIIDGIIADTEAPVRFQSKEVKMNLLMTADTLETLWHNYDLFLSLLVQQTTHRLYCNSTHKTYDCYYSKSKVSRFLPAGKPWLEFSLTLVFVGI